MAGVIEMSDRELTPLRVIIDLADDLGRLRHPPLRSSKDNSGVARISAPRNA